MAYVQDFSNDQEKEKQVPGSDGQLLSEQSGSIGPESGAAAAPEGQTRGSGYMNLSEYAKANEGSSADIANRVVEPVRKSTQEAKNASSAYQSNLGGVSGVKQNQQLQSTIQSSPQALAEKQWQDLFKSQTSGYQGPQSASDIGGYQDLVSKYQKAQQDQANLNNPGNLTAAVKSAYGTPQYTQGENALDAFLAGSGKGAEVLSSARQELGQSGIDTGLAADQQRAADAIQAAKAESQATADAARNAVTGRQKGFEDLFTSYGEDIGNRVSDLDKAGYNGILQLLGQQSKFDFTPRPAAPVSVPEARTGSVANTPVASAPPVQTSGAQINPFSQLVSAKNPSKFIAPSVGQAPIPTPGSADNMVYRGAPSNSKSAAALKEAMELAKKTSKNNSGIRPTVGQANIFSSLFGL